VTENPQGKDSEEKHVTPNIEEVAGPKQGMRPEVVIPRKTSSATEEAESAEPEPPIHPYVAAHDVTYAAPQNHNFGTTPKH